jgi:predicted secreted protein with PEFG-CTERM motif
VLFCLGTNFTGVSHTQIAKASKTIQYKSEAGQGEIRANYKAISSSVGENKAGTLFHFISTTTANNSKNSYIVSIDSKTFPITFEITGNGNKLNKISVAKDNTTLIVNIVSQSNGKLTIQLPRSLIDSKKQGNQDTTYAIFEDSQPWQRVQEIKSNSQARTLAIDFDKGTSVIEIAGSRVLPEFGTISAVVFAIAIVAIIVTSTKYEQFKFGSLWNH